MAQIRYQIRLPEELIEEAKTLVPAMGRDLRLTIHGQVTLADVLRLALAEGLEVLKQRYPAAERERPPEERRK
jgi:hypothetical protein